MPIGGSSGGLSSAGPGAGGGAQGPQGATGSQGAQGHQGFQGNQGTQGSGGAQGSQGNQGTTGAQGPQGGTSGQNVLAAVCNIITPDNDNGAQVIVPLSGINIPPAEVSVDWGSTCSDGIPHTCGAGHGFTFGIFTPTFSAGTLATNWIELGVSNTDGTEKLVIRLGNARLPLSLSSATDTQYPDGAADGSDWSVIEQIGVDLSIDVPNNRIKSTAGGQFFAYSWITFVPSGLAP